MVWLRIHYFLALSLLISTSFVPSHHASHLGSKHNHDFSVHSLFAHSGVQVIKGYDLKWLYDEQELENDCSLCLLIPVFSSHASQGYYESICRTERIIVANISFSLNSQLFSAYSPRAPPLKKSILVIG